MNETTNSTGRTGRTEYLRQWRAKNKDKVREAKKRYRATAEAKAVRAAYARKWRAENPELAKAADQRKQARFMDAVARGEAWAIEQRKKQIETSSEWQKGNRDAANAAKLRYRSKPGVKEMELAKAAEYRKTNPEKVRQSLAAYRERHPERIKEFRRRWMDNGGRAVMNRHAAKRKVVKASLLHPMRNEQAILELYEEARRLTEQTGITHHVDHIIPLSAKGWEHELNMQVLPFSVNCRKRNNPFWEHPDYLTWREVPRHLWPDELFEQYQERIVA